MDPTPNPKPAIGTPEWLQAAGEFNPFEGDFGDGTRACLWTWGVL